MKKIIILGGGAAGWLTALYCKKIYTNYEIKLIESKKIGILGAGEGSTPHLVNFLKFININILDLINKTKGTLKYGINFINWNGDGNKYFHGFGSKNNFNNFNVKNIFNGECYDKYLINCISKNLNLDNYTYGGLLVDHKKNDPNNQDFSLHFDAHLIADYLKDVAIKRGVLHVVNELKYIKTNYDGNINSVVLNDDQEHECDFIFDCSGFARLIIGKHFKTKWIDYQKHLPMKKAVPFFLEQEKEIQPCTHAVAMKYGWIWKIPLQHRFGSGYIFDSDFINEDEALLEAEEYLGQKLNSPKVIKFDAGRYENVWVNNCMAVGLSSGFTEPLEATSLYLSVQQLHLFAHFKESIFTSDKNIKDNFNKIIANNNDEILNFLYLHYLSKRNDSEFWKNFKNNTIVPFSFEEYLHNIKNHNLFNLNFKTNKAYAGFETESYLVVAYGLGLLDSKKTKEIELLEPSVSEYKNFLDLSINNLESHSKFLENINVSNNN